MSGLRDFNFSAFYYPEILAALMRLKAEAWPEHTEENEHDPVVQLYRAFALLSHLQACRLDHVARELFISTCQLRSSMIALARLSDYQLAPPAPATTDVLADLSSGLSSTTDLVRAHSLVATEGSADSPAVVFEYDEDTAYQAQATGAGNFLVLEDDGGVFTDVSSSLPAAIWAGAVVAGDALYVAHPELYFDKLGLEISGATAGAITGLRVEYYDDKRIGAPSNVTFPGPGLQFRCNTVVGSTDATGLEVIVTCKLTNQSETVTTTRAGGFNLATTTGTLGQTTPSTNPGDYTIRTYWPEFDGLDNPAGVLDTDGDYVLTWSEPQASTRRWAAGEVNGTTAPWLRLRAVAVGAAAGPTVDITEATKTTYSLLVNVRQGRRVEDKIGTTDSGTAGQRFTLQREPYMELVQLTVGGVEWVQVDNFLTAASFDQVFTLLEQADGAWVVEFGDGQNGRIPGASLAVVATYRIGGDTSGNVGAGAVSVDRTGNSKLRNWRNPRAASGWQAAEASDSDGLDLARVQIPASLRALGRAVSPDDYEALALVFTTEAGDTPVARALAIEEGAGPKTIELVCVAPGGDTPDAADLAELETYFHGEQVGLQRVGGVGLANMEVTATPYSPRTVNVTATVYVLADYATNAGTKVAAALEALLSPLARGLVQDTDGNLTTGTDWQWHWNQVVSRAALSMAALTASPGVLNFIPTIPAADITLAADELPRAGTISITVVSV